MIFTDIWTFFEHQCLLRFCDHKQSCSYHEAESIGVICSRNMDISWAQIEMIVPRENRYFSSFETNRRCFGRHARTHLTWTCIFKEIVLPLRLWFLSVSDSETLEYHIKNDFSRGQNIVLNIFFAGAISRKSTCHFSRNVSAKYTTIRQHVMACRVDLCGLRRHLVKFHSEIPGNPTQKRFFKETYFGHVIILFYVIFDLFMV